MNSSIKSGTCSRAIGFIANEARSGVGGPVRLSDAMRSDGAGSFVLDGGEATREALYGSCPPELVPATGELPCPSRVDIAPPAAGGR